MKLFGFLCYFCVISLVFQLFVPNNSRRLGLQTLLVMRRRLEMRTNRQTRR